MKAHFAEMRAVVENHSQIIPYLKKAGDMVLVNRGRPRLLIMVCPCGCGEQIVLNLDERAGPAWTFYKKKKKYSLYPSVWRDTGCQSHFILWNNEVLWFDYDSWWEDREDSELDEKVFSLFKVNRSQHYKDIAEQLDKVPWEILLSCRRLKKRGFLIEKKGKDNYGIFELKS